MSLALFPGVVSAMYFRRDTGLFGRADREPSWVPSARERLGARAQDARDDGVEPHALVGLREHERAVSAHGARVARHDVEARAHVGRQIGLVDDEEVGLGDARAALAGDLVTAG